MRRAIVAAALLCSCEAPKSAPASQDGVTKLAPPTAEQVAAAKQPTGPPTIAERIASGTISDAEIPSLVAQAEKNRTITFAHLKKNAHRYDGEMWGFRGKILEIGESGGETRARISLDDYGSKVMWVEAPFTTDFVEDNRVDVLGVLAGDYSYKSTAGWDITIPAIVAARITKPGMMAAKKRRRAADDDE